jgi:hypothetical protein
MQGEAGVAPYVLGKCSGALMHDTHKQPCGMYCKP